MRDILIKPIITEKSMQNAGAGKFTFKVNKKSNKTDIKRAAQDFFGVNVVSVATSIVKSGRKKVGQRRIEVSVSPWKKAIIELRKGQKIDLFDQVDSK